MNLDALGAPAPRRAVAPGGQGESGDEQVIGSARTRSTSSSRTPSTPTCRRSRSTGSAATRWAASRSCGAAPASAGASYEFTAPERHGYGINWPIGYDDIAPWYSHVERFIGVCGNARRARGDARRRVPAAVRVQLRRAAHERQDPRALRQSLRGAGPLGAPHEAASRSICSRAAAPASSRNLCMRGCPFGAYFSSNSSTLPWAAKTGNLTMRPDAVVHSIIYDERKGKATGVRVIDANTHAVSEYRARIIFVNASALNTMLILLNSTSARFPHGLGNDNGLLGQVRGLPQLSRRRRRRRSTASRTSTTTAADPRNASSPTSATSGRQEMDFVGGYTTFTGAYRERGEVTPERVGGAYKDALARPGPWGIYMYLQGETIPKEIEPRPPARDAEGPMGHSAAGHVGGLRRQRRADDPRLAHAGRRDARGRRLPRHRDARQPLGTRGATSTRWAAAAWAAIRRLRCSTSWNQLHACPNVFVTDGACMTSTGNQSPSLLYMALTARAVNHAVEELARQNL